MHGDLFATQNLVNHENVNINIRMYSALENGLEIFTPLSIAAEYGYADIVSFLLNSNLVYRYTDLNDALMKAIYGHRGIKNDTFNYIPHTDNTEAIRLLIAHGANAL